MSKNRWMTFVFTCLFMLTCSLSASAKSKQPIERGMTKQQVTAILGKPKTTSFNELGDKWMYEGWKGSLVGGDQVRTYVAFDTTGKVIRYEEQIYNPSPSEANANHPHPGITPGYAPMPYPDGAYCLSDAAFSILCKKVKEASFDKDKKNLIEVASLGCYYSCQQCAPILKIFSFDSEKTNALKLMAPRIVDPQNVHVICQQFTFDDGKKQAARLVRGNY